MFFMRLRRRVPFEGLAILFGISKQSASNYYGDFGRFSAGRGAATAAPTFWGSDRCYVVRGD